MRQKVSKKNVGKVQDNFDRNGRCRKPAIYESSLSLLDILIRFSPEIINSESAKFVSIAQLGILTWLRG